MLSQANSPSLLFQMFFFFLYFSLFFLILISVLQFCSFCSLDIWFLFQFCFCFSVRDFYYVLKLRYSFLSHVQSTKKSMKGIVHSHFVVFLYLAFLFWFCLRNSIPLLTWPMCSCSLSILYIKDLCI